VAVIMFTRCGRKAENPKAVR